MGIKQGFIKPKVGQGKQKQTVIGWKQEKLPGGGHQVPQGNTLMTEPGSTGLEAFRYKGLTREHDERQMECITEGQESEVRLTTGIF